MIAHGCNTFQPLRQTFLEFLSTAFIHTLWITDGEARGRTGANTHAHTRPRTHAPARAWSPAANGGTSRAPHAAAGGGANDPLETGVAKVGRLATCPGRCGGFGFSLGWLAGFIARE